jgi:hypothetical protein
MHAGRETCHYVENEQLKGSMDLHEISAEFPSELNMAPAAIPTAALSCTMFFHRAIENRSCHDAEDP